MAKFRGVEWDIYSASTDPLTRFVASLSGWQTNKSREWDNNAMREEKGRLSSHQLLVTPLWREKGRSDILAI